METNLSTTEAREEAFGLIGASFAVRIGLAVVDPLYVEASMQRVPRAGFIGMDHAARFDAGGDSGNGLILYTGHEGKRAAVALAHDDHDPTLAGLMLCETTVNAILFAIGGTDVTSEIGAIDLDLAGNGFVLYLGADRLAQIVA